MCTYDVNCTIPMMFIGAKISSEEGLQLRRNLGIREGGKKERETEEQKAGRAGMLRWLVSPKKDENRVGIQVCLEAIDSIISLLLHVRGLCWMLAATAQRELPDAFRFYSCLCPSKRAKHASPHYSRLPQSPPKLLNIVTPGLQLFLLVRQAWEQ